MYKNGKISKYLEWWSKKFSNVSNVFFGGINSADRFFVYNIMYCRFVLQTGSLFLILCTASLFYQPVLFVYNIMYCRVILPTGSLFFLRVMQTRRDQVKKIHLVILNLSISSKLSSWACNFWVRNNMVK